MTLKHLTLGERVRHYRMGLDWTLDQLSERTQMPDGSSVDKGTISAMEIRKSDRSKFTGLIARAFGLTIDQFMSDRDYLPDLLAGRIPIQQVEKPHDPESAEFEKAINTLRESWASGDHERRTGILMGIPILIGLAYRAPDPKPKTSDASVTKLVPKKPFSK